MSITYDEIVKDRITLVTTFADALVYIVDDGQTENNQLIVDMAVQGRLYDYIIEKYSRYPIVRNTVSTEYYKRYINPLYQMGFDIAESREKYKHAHNNGLLNIIGVSFDIIANWDNYISSVIEKLKAE